MMSSNKPIPRLAISSFSTISLRPIAFMDCRFSSSTGANINEKLSICMYGTHGCHLCVRSNSTSGDETAASNANAGIKIKQDVFTARRIAASIAVLFS